RSRLAPSITVSHLIGVLEFIAREGSTHDRCHGRQVRTGSGTRYLGGTMTANGIVEVTDANFDADVLKSDKPVLVDFWATWCGPCRAIAPIVDELAAEYQGKVKIGKMDVDRNSSTPMRYGVRGIPTLLVFKDGQVKEQIVGYVPKEQIQKALDKHVG